MSKKTISHEKIEMSLPINASYVLPVRLTASSIAIRIGFSIDEIEDIKAAVSEACSFIIKKSSANRMSVFKIVFLIQKDTLEIRISSNAEIIPSETDEEIGLLIIKAHMDNLEILFSSDLTFQIIMAKTHKYSESSETTNAYANSFESVDAV